MEHMFSLRAAACTAAKASALSGESTHSTAVRYARRAAW